MKKNTELSVAFAQGVEKNNRDFLKASLELVNKLENKDEANIKVKLKIITNI